MNPESVSTRMRFFARVLTHEWKHLSATDRRLFEQPFTEERARSLDEDDLEAERVEAFVSRFGRLQDTIGDKLLPVYLDALRETPGAAIDNLDRAERLGLIPSSDQWLALRKLRNQMIHEYTEDPGILAAALQSGHEFVPSLGRVVEVFLQDMRRRGWNGPQGEERI